MNKCRKCGRRYKDRDVRSHGREVWRREVQLCPYCYDDAEGEIDGQSQEIWGCMTLPMIDEEKVAKWLAGKRVYDGIPIATLYDTLVCLSRTLEADGEPGLVLTRFPSERYSDENVRRLRQFAKGDPRPLVDIARAHADDFLRCQPTVQPKKKCF
jgi:hypothetical protein